jgi:hypothetical protein
VKKQFGFTSVELIGVFLGVGCIAAWLTHVVACIKAGAYVLLLAGALVAPVGVIHGVMLWFGAGWTN